MSPNIFILHYIYDVLLSYELILILHKWKLPFSREIICHECYL